MFARCLHRDPRGESRRRVETLLFVRESSLAKKFSEHGGVRPSLGDGESRRAKLGHLAARRRGWTAVGGVSGDAQDALGARDAHGPLPFEIFPRVLRFVVVVVVARPICVFRGCVRPVNIRPAVNIRPVLRGPRHERGAELSARQRVRRRRRPSA